MKNNDRTLFLLAVIAMGFAQGLMDSSFNNFLGATFVLSSSGRTLLELPREFPGFLTAFVSALLFFFGSRTLAGVSQLLAAAGMFLIAFFAQSSTAYGSMLAFLFIYSLGQHLFMPLFNDIGMSLAKEGSHGQQLGDLQGGQNFASIAGFLFVFVGFKFFHAAFGSTFMLSASVFCIASFLLFRMKQTRPHQSHGRLHLKKEYGMFYWLSILFGTRKQIFITFAPWVLVSVFKRPVQDVAMLLVIGGVLGIGFKPLLGRGIDRWGERSIMVIEAVSLIIICALYGSAQRLFPQDRFGNIAFLVVCGCYIVDNLLMAASMARATYIKKVARSDSDLSSALAMGQSIDHVFSITIALVGGFIWTRNGVSGYEWVFLGGAGIAIIQLATVLQLKIRKAAVKGIPAYND